MSVVPIIDLSGFAGDLAARQAVAKQIDAACRETGFLCITGHGVPAELIAQVRDRGLAFFDEEEAKKREIERRPPSFRGYIPLASEGLARSTGRADAAADLKEAFSMGPVNVPADAYHTAPEAAAHFAPNRWPTTPGYREAYEAYYRELSALADRLLSGFALALGLPENWFADKVDRHISNIRALHYPAQEVAAAPGQLRAGEHTDYGCLTILLTDTAPGGLEVLTKSGEWAAVPHVPGSFVVNIGDLMAQWSNDVYVSTLHRVVNPPAGTASRRLSIAFFHQPNYDALIECIPGCERPGEPPRYAPITSGDHRLMKVMRANQPAMA
ncbi:isopenicillin N synthase family oxygenase [Acetobacteraceae bacterium H6797]|nr:isopenicillin N synthase family oxygenase [Acetobacteraceae bacterium H6797]